MAREQFSKIAYKTLQQGKSIAGLAHKEISARIMNFIIQEKEISTFNLDKSLLIKIQNSMDLLIRFNCFSTLFGLNFIDFCQVLIVSEICSKFSELIV